MRGSSCFKIGGNASDCLVDLTKTTGDILCLVVVMGKRWTVPPSRKALDPGLVLDPSNISCTREAGNEATKATPGTPRAMTKSAGCDGTRETPG